MATTQFLSYKNIKFSEPSCKGQRFKTLPLEKKTIRMKLATLMCVPQNPVHFVTEKS